MNEQVTYKPKCYVCHCTTGIDKDMAAAKGAAIVMGTSLRQWQQIYTQGYNQGLAQYAVNKAAGIVEEAPALLEEGRRPAKKARY